MLRLLAFVLVLFASADFFRDESFPDIASVPAEILSNYSQLRCVALDSSRREVHALHMGRPPVLTFSFSGAYLRGWGDDVLFNPHGCEMRGNELWVADAVNDSHTKMYGDFTVRRIDAGSGQLLTKLGTSGIESSAIDPLEFGEVTDVSFTPDGDVFITDGGDGDGVNERLVRLDGSSFKPLWIRGNNGTVPTSDDPIGTFSQLHSVAYDSIRDLVWVADRAHSRIVAIAASNGAFLGHWTCIADVTGNGPNSVRFDNKRDRVVITLGTGGPTGKHTDAMLLALKGNAEILHKMGECAFDVDPIDLKTTVNAHEIAVDAETGDVYTAMEGKSFGMLWRFLWQDSKLVV